MYNTIHTKHPSPKFAAFFHDAQYTYSFLMFAEKLPQRVVQLRWTHPPTQIHHSEGLQDFSRGSRLLHMYLAN